MNYIISIRVWQLFLIALVIRVLEGVLSPVTRRFLTYLKTRRRQRAAYRYEPKVYYYEVSTDLSKQKGLVEAGEKVTITLPHVKDEVKFEIYRTTTGPNLMATPEKEPK